MMGRVDRKMKKIIHVDTDGDVGKENTLPAIDDIEK